MGYEKNKLQEKRDKGGKRGSTNNQSRLEAFGRGSGTTAGDWGGCDAGRMQAVVVGITGLGGAVTFGLSRNGGAHSVTLMLDGERQSLWFNGDADLTEELRLIIDKLEAMS